MFKVSCKDVGSMDCNFEATGESADEVVEKVVAHAKEVHADKLKEMSATMSEDQMKEMVRSKVQQV